MKIKFDLEDKVSLKNMIEYFSFIDYPIIMEKLETDKKWITNKSFENFINFYNKDINLSNLPEIKNKSIFGIYNILNEINFIKVRLIYLLN